jgi:hypothetical protein
VAVALRATQATLPATEYALYWRIAATMRIKYRALPGGATAAATSHGQVTLAMFARRISTKRRTVQCAPLAMCVFLYVRSHARYLRTAAATRHPFPGTLCWGALAAAETPGAELPALSARPTTTFQRTVEAALRDLKTTSLAIGAARCWITAPTTPRAL